MAAPLVSPLNTIHQNHDSLLDVLFTSSATYPTLRSSRKMSRSRSTSSLPRIFGQKPSEARASVESTTTQNGFRETVRGALNISRAGTTRTIRRALSTKRRRQQVMTPLASLGEGNSGVRGGRILSISAPIVTGDIGTSANRLCKMGVGVEDLNNKDGEQGRRSKFTGHTNEDKKEKKDKDGKCMKLEDAANMWWQRRKMSKKDRRNGVIVTKESLFCVPKLDPIFTTAKIFDTSDEDKWTPDITCSCTSSPISPWTTSPGTLSNYHSSSPTTSREDPIDSMRWSFVAPVAPSSRRKSMKRKESMDVLEIPERFTGQSPIELRRGSTLSNHTFGIQELNHEMDVSEKREKKLAPCKRRRTSQKVPDTIVAKSRMFSAVVDGSIAGKKFILGPHPCENVKCIETLESILAYYPARNAFEAFIKTKKEENQITMWMMAKAYRLVTEYTKELIEPLRLQREAVMDEKVDGIEDAAKTKLLTNELPQYVDSIISQVEASATVQGQDPPENRDFRETLGETARGLFEVFCITEAENDDEGTIIMVSDAFQMLTGYDREETLAKDPDSLKTPSPISPRNAHPTMDLLVDRKKDGSRFYNLVFTAPLHMLGSGEVLYKLNALVDVTMLVRQEVVNRVLFGDGNETADGRAIDVALGSWEKKARGSILKRLRTLDRALKSLDSGEGSPQEVSDADSTMTASGTERSLTPASTASCQEPGPQKKVELGNIFAWLKNAYGQFFVVAPSAHSFVISFVSPILDGFSSEMQGSEVFEWIEFGECTEILKKLRNALKGREVFSVMVKWSRQRDRKILKGVPLFTADQDAPFAWVCLLLVAYEGEDDIWIRFAEEEKEER